MRLTFEELDKLKEKFGTDRLWSWSRVNAIHNSMYEYFLKYVKKVKPDRNDSIYVVTGGIAHDIIEKFYNKEIAYDDMLEEFNDGWTLAFDIGEMKFNRSDSDRNNSIADKYYANLEHFFTNHTYIPQKLLLEQFITIKIGDEYFQGYIDALKKNENGDYEIIDWKTSSIYLGEKAKNESGQLVLYAIGLNQRGIPFDKIKICWNFLKYVNVLCEKPQYVNLTWTTVKGEEKKKEKLDKNKIASTLKASVKALLKDKGYSKEDIEIFIAKFEKENNIEILPSTIKQNIKIEECEVENKPRQIERSKIGESLQANVKAQMKKLNYTEDEIFEALNKLLETNSIECLPEDVQKKYQVSDCYVYVDLTDELIKHWKDYIIETTAKIREMEDEYSKDKNEKIWWENEEQVEAESYYLSNLCSYSPKLHKPYGLYLDKYNAEKDGISFTVNGVKKETEEIPEDDLSWLEEI